MDSVYGGTKWEGTSFITLADGKNSQASSWTVLLHIVGPCIATTEQIAILYSSISFHVVCSPHTMVTSKMNCENPLQKEAEAASIDSVMAEDHAVLLKSVKKSKLKAAFFKWLFYKKWPQLNGNFTTFVLCSPCSVKEKRCGQIQFRRWKRPSEDQEGNGRFFTTCISESGRWPKTLWRISWLRMLHASFIHH